MNYAGNFDFGLLGNSSSNDDGTGVVTTRVAADASAIVVDDAQLLFGGDYARRGSDLVLSKDGHDHVIADYFKGAQRKALSSSDGATLSPDLVKALVGEVQVAQAGGAAAGATQVIGSVSKLAGSATAIRNGVSVMLNVGDNVQKGDVVQAGADSSLNLTFIDGTVFGLSANARMVLNEMVYDPQGSSNSSLLSLIQGTITFVAGETAKNGDMRVDTPVATMGIRGTAVLVEIGFEVPGQGSAPPVKFQVLVEPNGRTGSYVLYNKNTGAILGTVNQAGQVTSITGGGDLSVGTAEPLSSIAQSIIQQTLQQYFPSYVPNANPRSGGGGGGSTPSDPNSGTNPDPLKFAPPPEPFPGQPFQVPINLPGSDANTPPVNVTITRFNSAPTVTVTPVVVVLPQDQTSFDIGKQVVIADPDADDVATPYVPGSARIVSATGPNGTPASLNLKSLVIVDPQTGHVSYDPVAFKFLAAGQKAVYVIEFDSQSGPDTTHQTLTFTVDGTNDAPVVTTALTGAATQGQAVQSFDLLAGASDPDLGETASLTVGNVKYALNGDLLQNGAPSGVTLTGTVLHVDPTAFAYLGAGQTATLVVTYAVIDAHGASVTQHETITITGTNDGPEIDADNTTATATATLGSEGVSAQGSIAFADADLGDIHQADAIAATGTIGSLTLSITESNGSAANGNVSWTYHGDPTAIAAALMASETGSIEETFTVTIDDGHGGSIEQPVTVTIAANVWTGGIGQFRFSSEAAPRNNWSSGGNWSLGEPPDGTQFVLFNSNVTINLDVTAHVGALLIGNCVDILLTASGNGRTLNVAGDVVNHGDVTLAPGVTLHVSGDIHNYGQLTIDHHTAGSTLLIDGHVELDGGGTVSLDGSADRITGVNHSSTLENIDNKIDGYGKIGDGHLTLINAAAGIIAATDLWHGITINTGLGTFTNDGLIVSASLFGGLRIAGDLVNNGTIEARKGVLEIDGDVTGGSGLHHGGHAVIDGGVLKFGGASNSNVLFSGNTADLLVLEDPWHFSGTVTGFSFGDTIDLEGVSWWNVRLIDKGDWLQVKFGNYSFRIDGDYDANHFLVTTDFHGGTIITWLDQAPQIETDDLRVSQHGQTTTITGLSMFDDDAGRRENFSYEIVADGHSTEHGSGRLATINSELSHGFSYTAQNGETVGKVAVTVTDGHGASDTVNFIFGTANALATSSLALNGTAGKDVLIATSHADTLTGGASADQFVFQSKSGQHVITDFAVGQDKIEFDFVHGSNYAFRQWLSDHASQQGADTLITFGNHDGDGSLLLKHINVADLKASDFIHGGGHLLV